jgi:hypothetical protein
LAVKSRASLILEIESGTLLISKSLLEIPHWPFRNYVTRAGWNEVFLPIAASFTTGGTIDLTAVNYLRILFRRSYRELHH